MEKKQQYDLMQKIIRELEDLANSQTSVLKKIAQIEADNINLSNNSLGNVLPDVHESVDTGVTKINELLGNFQQDVDNFKTKYEKDLAEDPTA